MGDARHDFSKASRNTRPLIQHHFSPCEQAVPLHLHYWCKDLVMSPWMKMSLAVMVLAAAIACGSSSTTPTPTPVTARIVSGGFTPDPINVSVGSTVTWMNMDATMHAIAADNA